MQERREIFIDGGQFTTRPQMHDYLQGLITGVSYEGRNLDALHDALASICTPTLITVQNLDTARNFLNGYVDRTVAVFVAAAVENPNLDLVIDD